MQVVSTSGDTHLGGEDFDHRVMDYFMKLVKRKYKVCTAGTKSSTQFCRWQGQSMLQTGTTCKNLYNSRAKL